MAELCPCIDNLLMCTDVCTKENCIIMVVEEAIEIDEDTE